MTRITQTVSIAFPGTDHPPVTLNEGDCLSQQLTVVNSPVLFGCRTGICGTCLVQIEEGVHHLPPPDEKEREALEVYAPDNPKARLACQMSLTANIALRVIPSA